MLKPVFGNSYTIDQNGIVRDSLNNDLQIGRPSARKTISGFSMKFENLDEEEKDFLVNAFVSSAGQEVNFKDHEGFIWLGVFNSTIQVLDDRIGVNLETNLPCPKYTVEFSFQGDKIDGTL